MNATLEDYRKAVEDFVDYLLDETGEDLISVLLFGSLARGDAQPGRSDLLDAFVYFNGLFEDKDRFIETLKIMVEACDRLSQTGLPYQHPFQYWSSEEIDSTPAMYLPLWQSDKHSRVLYGRDIRPEMKSLALNRATARVSFFEARRMGHHLAAYLHKQELTELDRERILDGVKLLRKFVPPMACMVLDVWTNTVDAIPEIRRLLPGLDLDRIKGIEHFMRNYDAAAGDPEEAREALRTTLTFIEDLHDQILARVAVGPAAGLEPRPR